MTTATKPIRLNENARQMLTEVAELDRHLATTDVSFAEMREMIEPWGDCHYTKRGGNDILRYLCLDGFFLYRNVCKSMNHSTKRNCGERLEAAGLIEFGPDSSDRKTYVRLTDAGRAYLNSKDSHA